MTVLAAHPAAVRLLADGLPNVGINHNAPGANAFTEIIGVLMFYGLLAGLAGLIISAMVFGLGRWLGNHMAAVLGRIGVFASLGTAILVGGGSNLINWAFNLGNTIH